MSLPKDTLPEVVHYPLQDPWHIVPLGEGLNGQLIQVNLKVTPHILIAGSRDNNAGLSSLLHYEGSIVNSTLAHALKSSQTWKVYGLDMRNRLGLNQLASLSIVESWDTTYEHCVKTVEALLDEVQKRYHRMGNSAAHLYELPNFSPVLILIDDLEFLDWPVTTSHPAALQEETHRRKLMMMLGEIARIGGSVGMHILAGLQFPKQNFNHLVRSFSCRVVTAPLGEKAKSFIIDEREETNTIPLLFPNQKPGRAYVQTNENIVKFQLFRTPFDVLNSLEKTK